MTNHKRLLCLLDKSILINLYIFAFGSSISKALTSISGGFICIIWLAKLIITRDFRFQISSVGLPFLIFIAGILISGINGWNSETLDTTGKYLLLALFYFAVINSNIELTTIKKLTFTTLASMLISSLYGLYQHYFLHLNRVKAFCGPLAFGNLLAIIMIFTISYILWGKIKNKYKVLLFFTTIVFGLNLLFTQTRGAWLGFLSALFVLFWIKNKKIIIFATIIFLGLSLLLPQVYVDRFYSSFDTENNPSNLTRIALWKGALLMFRDNPINGVGIENFSRVYETRYKEQPLSTTVHAHNNFLHFMAEIGIIGLLPFTWLMFEALKLLYYNFKVNPNPNWKLYILASFCALIIFNIQGLTENTFSDAETVRFFWYLLGLDVIISKKFKTDYYQNKQGSVVQT